MKSENAEMVPRKVIASISRNNYQGSWQFKPGSFDDLLTSKGGYMTLNPELANLSTGIVYRFKLDVYNGQYSDQG